MSFTCPDCGMTSHNPNDERWGWCGNCNAFTSPEAKARGMALARQASERTESADAPQGMEYRCEECAFATPWEQAAFAHCDDQHHSLGLAPLPREHRYGDVSGDCKCRHPGFICDRCEREFCCGSISAPCPECGQGRENDQMIAMWGDMHATMTAMRRESSPERFIDPLAAH